MSEPERAKVFLRKGSPRERNAFVIRSLPATPRHASGIVGVALALALGLSIAVAAQQFTDYRTVLIGRADPSTYSPGGQDNPDTSISADGAHIAYVGPGPRTSEVYAQDINSRRTELISRANGGAPANGASSEPASSGSGTDVAFASKASNLGGRGGTSSVYLRLSDEGRTILISRASGQNGAPANGDSYSPSVSSEGAQVVFASTATNLAPGARGGVINVYLRNLRTNQTTLISRSSNGGSANGDSTEPHISAAGNAIVFQSSATNLVPRFHGAGSQVYETKLRNGRTFLISVSSDGKPANQPAIDPSVDENGSRVAFESAATNLSGLAHHVDNIYVRDVARNQDILASRSGGGSRAIANGNSAAPDLPRDGRFVCFESQATNLGNPYDGFGVDPRVSNVYVHDTLHHGTFLISRRSGRYSKGGNGDSSNVACSTGASYAAFQSDATNLGSAGRGATNVYWRSIFGGR